MCKERAKDLQDCLTKKAVLLLAYQGGSAETKTIEESIRILGAAWELPEADTRSFLELIDREKQVVAEQRTPDDPAHALNVSELPKTVTDAEIYDDLWTLFETATLLDDEAQRITMYNMGKDLEEYRTTIPWMVRPPEERQAEPQPELTGP